jgi:hypothetical protein
MKLLTKIALTGIGLTVLMWLALMTPSPAQAKTCGSTVGAFTFLDGSCSSDNQANDGDDVKAFLDKGGSATFLGPDIDMSLSSNTSALIDQNVRFKDLSVSAGTTGFTDGNGFANIKSVGDALQAWEIDPIDGSFLSRLGIAFPGFDGLLFRGQFTDLGGGAGKNDSASLTLVVNLSDGTTVQDTFSGLKLKADDGVFGFDENSALPKGLFVDSVEAFTDENHAFDQVKQIEFSVPGAIAVIPEPKTWVMLVAGFAFMAILGVGRNGLRRKNTASLLLGKL